jgi:hypothetical protein
MSAPQIISSEQLVVAMFNVVVPGEDDVAQGRMPPLVKLDMLLQGGQLHKWTYFDAAAARMIGETLRAGGEQIATYPPQSHLIIADGSAQQAAQRFFDGLNRPQG